MRVIGRPLLQYGFFRVAEAWVDFAGNVASEKGFAKVEHNSLCLQSAGNDFYPEVIIEAVGDEPLLDLEEYNEYQEVDIEFSDGNICVRDAMGELCSEVLDIDPGSYSAHVWCAGRDRAVGYQFLGSDEDDELDEEEGELSYGDPVERWLIRLTKKPSQR